jgi:peptidoglycan/xylan/chitin deacetylase (PgdA/CDA1 family)
MASFLITTSWDDGNPLDMRIAELLEKYNIKGTFYIPTKNATAPIINKSEILELSKGFEIGGHTSSHAVLTTVALPHAQQEVVDNKSYLECCIGRTIDAFAYPLGFYNQEVETIVKGAGFNCARTDTIMETAHPHAFTYHPTSICADRKVRSPIKQLIIKKQFRLLAALLNDRSVFASWDRLARATLEYTATTGGVWHLWGHSWEIAVNNDWRKLESLFEYISDYLVDDSCVSVSNGELFK